MAKKNSSKGKGKNERVAYQELFWCPNEVEMRRENGTKRRKKSIDSVQNVISETDDPEGDPSGEGRWPPGYEAGSAAHNEMSTQPGSAAVRGEMNEKGPSAGQGGSSAMDRIGENMGDFGPEYYRTEENLSRGGAGGAAGGDPAAANPSGGTSGPATVIEAGREREEEEDGEEGETLPPSQIKNMGSVTAKTPRGNIHCMTIIGQVEGHYILPPQNKTTKYEHIIPTLVAVEESPEIDGLLIMLNTVGGDVEAGLAIAEMISTMSKPTVSLVLGGGHSIGVPLAVSARRSFIVPTATMTIHPVRMNGLVVGVPQTMSYFDRMQERIIGFVSEQSEMPAKRMRELMFKTGELSTDVGSVLSGEDAVREGLMDYLGGLSDALDCLYEMIERREKKALRRARKRH